MTPKTRGTVATTQDLAGAIKYAHQELAAASDRIHANLGVTAAMRGVLADLSSGGPHSVPSIARDRGVSRQHIQRVTNSLADAGLVGFVANPDDARTAFVELTDAGRDAVRSIERAERSAYTRLGKVLDLRSLEDTTASLEEFADSLRTVRTR